MRNLETVIKRLKSIKALVDNSTEDLDLGYHYKPFDDKVLGIIRSSRGVHQGMSIVGGEKLLLEDDFITEDIYTSYTPSYFAAILSSYSSVRLLSTFEHDSYFISIRDRSRRNFLVSRDGVGGFIINLNIGIKYIDLINTIYEKDKF